MLEHWKVWKFGSTNEEELCFVELETKSGFAFSLWNFTMQHFENKKFIEIFNINEKFHLDYQIIQFRKDNLKFFVTNLKNWDFF